MKNKIISIFMVMCLCFLAVACSEQSPNEDIKKITFYSEYLTFINSDPQKAINDFSDGNGCVSAYANEDGSATVEFYESQWKGYIEDGEKILEQTKNDFADIQDGYAIEYQDDYKTINFYYNLDLPAEDAIYNILKVEMICCQLQIYNGADENSWKVTVNIYNSDTGKLVTTGNPDELGYTEEDWRASM